MELILALIQWAQQNPSAEALITVVGLGTFMKLIGVPVIKSFAQYINKPIFGNNTTLVAIAASVIIAEIAGLSMRGFSIANLLQFASVGFTAGFTAVGIQETTSAVKRPDRF